MTFPTGKLSPVEWLAADGTERDAIGNNDSLRVGDFCSLLSNGSRHICASVDGANVSTWSGTVGSAFADAYEVDFTGLSTQDLKSGGDGSKTVDGNTWTLTNSAAATSVDLTNGTGLVVVHATGSSNINGATETSPILTVPAPTLAPTATVTDDFRLYVFFEIANLNSNAELACVGYRAPSSWNTTKNSALAQLGYGSKGAETFALALTGASQTDATSGQTPAARPSTDRVHVLDLVGGWGRLEHRTGITYSGGWPADSGLMRIATGQWMVESEVTDDVGFELQIILGLIDTDAGDTNATVTFKRMLLQRRAA